MKQNINKLLREALVREIPARRRQLKQLHQLVEKKIRVGDNITKKLRRVNNKLSNNLLNFINSDDIKDDANVDYVDYDNKNEKLFTVGYEDQRGNNKERLMKFNKLITYLGGTLEDIKGYEVEELMSHLKSADLDNFKVVDGKDILWAYHCENYDEGETMGSCMRYDAAQSYLKIYTNNPDEVKCLVLLNPENNKVRGRALIWHCDDDSKFMDRIYVTNNQYRAEFNSYAEEHGLDTGHPSSDVSLTIYGDYDEYPYMDTFSHYTPENGMLSTNHGEIVLQDTHGGYNEPGMYSEHHDEYIPEDEAIYIEHMDSFMWFHEVEQDLEGNWVYPHSSDIVRLTVGENEGEYCNVDDIVELCYGEIAFNEDVIYIDKGECEDNYILTEDAVEDYENKDIPKDEAEQVTLGEYEGEYVVHDEAVMVVQGDELYGVLTDVDDTEPYIEKGFKIMSYTEYYH